jgi:hypothetical protein
MSFLKAFLRLKDKSAPDEKTQLKELGLDVLRSEALAWRLGFLQEFLEFMNRGDVSVEEKIKQLDKAIKLAAAPWGRGGDRGAFAKMMMHWELLLKGWRDYLALKEEAEKLGVEGLDKMIDRFGEREVIPYGMMILDVAWLHIDVAPQYAVVVQNTGLGVAPGLIIPTASSLAPGGEAPPKPPAKPAPPFVERKVGGEG